MGAKTLGAQRAFAAASDGDAGEFTQRGMTYRQWLIGMALCGALADHNTTDAAKRAIERVDETLAELAKELPR